MQSACLFITGAADSVLQFHVNSKKLEKVHKSKKKTVPWTSQATSVVCW